LLRSRADGLPKADEFIHKTSTSNADTDGDGYTDGVEVKNGWSPVVAEKAMESNLVKTHTSPQVYLVQHNTRRHISSAEVFLRSGYRWSDIVNVSERFLDSLTEGDPL